MIKFEIGDLLRVGDSVSAGFFSETGATSMRVVVVAVSSNGTAVALPENCPSSPSGIILGKDEKDVVKVGKADNLDAYMSSAAPCWRSGDV